MQRLPNLDSSGSVQQIRVMVKGEDGVPVRLKQSLKTANLEEAAARRDLVIEALRRVKALSTSKGKTFDLSKSRSQQSHISFVGGCYDGTTQEVPATAVLQQRFVSQHVTGSRGVISAYRLVDLSSMGICVFAYVDESLCHDAVTNLIRLKLRQRPKPDTRSSPIVERQMTFDI